ncbi:DUF5996 family protein [Tateyamaria omphalii]|uniref:Ava_C0101 and related proteins n=1 Tax=Tateyamaria omphalii TaxID=299262 RepID=A0A1P8MU61_9RHOB|nr:DUF5996 family protein [Tateyamaria omphalii]APX11637.1 hypothetical protein BWR18_08025 [Tateyamaria omphalii]
MSWPALDYPKWKDTGDSLHMWAQIVGKFRLAHTPWVNHSWHATLYADAQGLTTGLVPGGYEVRFNFVSHQLQVLSVNGDSAAFDLRPMSVAAFDTEFKAALGQVGAPTDYHHFPNEVPDPIPFHQQTAMGSYDPVAAHDWWRAIAAMAPVFQKFRTGFLGKVSPVHLFWGSFDLAVTRFSGRPAPLHPGGFPALPDAVTQEAYSHEVSSAGFWAGGNGAEEAMFYNYAYPVPDGFADAPAGPEGAYFDKDLGEFLLPYRVVATADDPAATLIAFLQATYDAAADSASWDRAALDCAIGEKRVPRSL